MTPAALADRVKRAAAEIGYVRCGITTTAPFHEFGAAVERLIAGQPQLSPLYERFRARVDPRGDAPWARSIVVAVRRYGRYRLPAPAVGHIGRNYLCDRRVPANPDSARPARMKEALRGLGLRVKTGSGTSDRWAAARAGVARLARNTFAVAEGCGSWINIECWRVDADLPADPPALDDPCPPDCRRCLEACPTDALAAPRTMRMDRCVAWLTYRAPWPIAPDLWRRMGPWIYGCDACQEACPLNRGAWRENEPMPWMDAIRERLTPAALATMSDEDYRGLIHPFFPYIPADDAERWRANARRAAAFAPARDRDADTSASSPAPGDAGGRARRSAEDIAIGRVLGYNKSMGAELEKSAEDAGSAVSRLRRLFWDHPFVESDLQEHPVWVVERVLDYGALEDVRTLRRYYGRARFLELAAQAARVSPKTRRFWACVLEQEGVSCVTKFSRPAHWR